MSQVTTRNGVDSLSQTATAEDPNSRRRRRRAWMLVTAAILVAGGAAGAWWLVGGAADRSAGHSAASGASTPAAARAIPVVAIPARTGDLPIHIDGLGTVTALNTVTVRTRIDGQLVRIAFAEGQFVHEGDLLAEIDGRTYAVQLEQAQGQLARDAALLKNARTDLQRYQDASAAVPRQQVDTAASVVSQYEAALQVDQSQIDSAKLQLAYCHILSPITGKIGLRLVDAGNMVHAGDPGGLAVITQLQPIAVLCSLPQDDLPRVRRAMSAGEVTVDAYDRSLRNRLSTGKLLAMDSQIDASTGTVRLKALFDNQDEALFPNQFVNARLLVDTRRAAVLVPAAAVQRSAQSLFVFVVRADETVEVRPVTLGPTEGDTTCIAEGLAAGEVVVTDGVDKLQGGTRVAVRDGREGRDDAAKDSSKKTDAGGPAR
jgi:multidrug efflux system membrane fusion protein